MTDATDLERAKQLAVEKGIDLTVLKYTAAGVVAVLRIDDIAAALAEMHLATVEQCALAVESEGISPTIQHIAAKVRALATTTKE